MEYEGAVYRPPSEARSLIIQVTIGCAHNGCTFCTMYKDKKFRIRSKDVIFKDLREMAEIYGDYPLRIFLADGDALTLPTEMLIDILAEIHRLFSKVQRVTVYGTALDVIRKSEEELTVLKNAGLVMVYMGAESGDKDILKWVHKGITREQMIEAGEKLHRVGIELSLTLISGLGGRKYLQEHAKESAWLVSRMKPKYLGFLTLMLEEGAPILDEIRSGNMELLSPEDVVQEMRIFLKNVDSEGTVFRSNHASNYIILKGILNQDIPKMLDYLDDVEQKQRFRPERSRRL